MLCLIGINLNSNKIELRSFVTIGTSKYVDLCIDYTTASECMRCQNGYHLENGVCYQNIPSCVSYVRNLCIECRTFSLLVENKCLSDCEVLRDTRSIKFYHNHAIGAVIPSLDRSYFAFWGGFIFLIYFFVLICSLYLFDKLLFEFHLNWIYFLPFFC